MDATLFSNRVEFTELSNAITLAGSDILRGEVVKVQVPNVPGNAVTFVRLFLCGDAREAYGEYYDVDFRNLANQPTWTDRVDTVGAFTCLTDLTPIFRKPISTGGGGGQVDTVTGGTATFVDATDPVNLISNVLVDGVTIGVNGLNQLEVPAGGGGYVPTIRTINTTAPLTGGGNLSANRTIGIPQANGSTDGFLDSSDWTTFNDKGDVDGPGSAVDDDIALFDGITGKLIKSAGINLTEVVEGSGFGDASLIESTGASPIILKDVKDGDGTTVQSNTGSFQINVEAKNSVEVDAGEVQLVGDDAAPGNSEYYGTDGSGIKGFHPIPAPTGAALTRTDDTNVTLTLGGSPSTALLAAASITAGWTGELSIARGGTGQSTQTAAFDALAPTTTKGDLIVHNGTDNIRVAIGSDGMVPFADSGATSGVKWRYPVLEVTILSTAWTLTNQPNTLEMLTATNPGILITRFDLTNYTEVMLQIHVFVASVSANSPRIILGYANSYTTTAGSYSDIGTSAVTCSMSSTGIIRTAWIPIAAGARGDVYISPLSNGGNATADPQIQGIRMYVR